MPGWPSNYWGGDERADTAIEVDAGEDTPPPLVAACQKLRTRYNAVTPGWEGNEPRPVLSCYRTKAGSADGFWSLLIIPAKKSSEYTRWRLLYTDAKGQTLVGRAWAAGDGGDPAAEANNAPSLPGVLAISDLDGDGRQEIVTGVSEWTDSGQHIASTVNAWTAKRRSIDELEVTRKRRVVYFDHGGQDGLGPLQLIVDPYATPMAPLGMTFGGNSGWARGKVLWSLAVALDGAAKPRDDGPESVDYARKLCPTLKGLLEGIKAGSEDNPECMTGYVHCAHVWGLPAEDVEKALAEYCAPPEMRGQGGPCEYNLPRWEWMMTVPLPIKLTQP